MANDDEECFVLPGSAWSLLGYVKEELDDNQWLELIHYLCFFISDLLIALYFVFEKHKDHHVL